MRFSRLPVRVFSSGLRFDDLLTLSSVRCSLCHMGLYEFEFEFISPYATPPRIFLYPLHSNGHVRCPLRCAVVRYRAPCSARGSDQISQQNRTGYRGAAMEAYGEQDRRRPGSPCANHTLVPRGLTAVECTPRTRTSAGPPLLAARGGSGPITSLPGCR